MRFLRIGLLGGGQLARMMLPTCQRLGLESHVLDGAGAVASSGCDKHTIGDFRNYDDVLNFGRGVDVLTVDLEDVNTEALAQLEREGVLVTPSSAVIRTVQDKGEQKLFFEKNQIPTARFKLYQKGEVPQEDGIIKLRRGGYDGKGVSSFKREAGLPTGFEADLVWEEKIKIKSEISVLVARSKNGDECTYEPVSMVFDPELNLIDYTLAPGSLGEALKKKARELALKVARELEVYGVMAVEMFETEAGALLVNELAPRPHNSGHHTIESTLTNQFAQHVRAVCALPLGSVHQHSLALTYNLVMDKKALSGPVELEGLDELLKLPGVFLHWYGKYEGRAGRKMGHVTLLSPTNDLKELLTLYRKAKSCLKIKTLPLLA